MGPKKSTLLWIPDDPQGIKQLRIPRLLPGLLLVLLVAAGLLTGYLLHDYIRIKPKMSLLSRLEKENRQQKKQFEHLVQRLSSLAGKINKLSEFDKKLKVMVNLETGEEGTEEGLGGSDPALTDPRQFLKMSHQDMVRSMHRSLDSLDADILMGEETKQELLKFLESQKTLLASTPSIWPTKGWMSSGFGYRISPFTGQKELHKGIDISTRMNAPVVAPADGIAAKIYYDRGYGRTLVLKHGYGIRTRFAHLSKVLVKKGQYVKRGETVALAGNSGRSTGPHLHYEVHLNGVAVNPRRYILN